MGADGDTFAIEVLGPIRVVDGTGRDSTPSGVLQRRLLALLALRRGAVVSADEAIEAAWPTDRPRDPAAALQTHLFRLRRVLPPGVVESVGDGYRLDASRVTLDADRLAAAVVAAEVDADAADVVESLLARWQGPAYPELVEVDAGRLAASSLEDLRVRAIEVGAGLELRAGRRAEAIARLAVLADEHPLRERPRSLLMAALAEEGRRVDALRVFDDFRRLLGDELGIDPSPALQEQHAALLGVGSPAATSSPERPHPPSVAASPLPIALTSLVGRDSLVDRVLGFVGACRLVTLVGPGGVGKTRLLLEVGTRLVAGNPDRPVVWCELATAAPDDVTGVVASVMQIDAQQGTSLEDRLATVLAGSEVVVLLDNCEHVLDDVARLVEHLLARCPRLHVVCTTRERLRVPGEQLCVVPTLPIDDEHDPAAQLFVERARAVAPDFEPDAAARSCIGEVVRRLDGLPLAIELAAARLHTMDVFSIAAALDRRFVLLAAGRRTSARHGSLRAALAWSVEMLDRRARDVFSELAVFNGAFSVGDVMAVSQLDRDTASIVIDLLAERSLVARTAGRRFTMLETMRAFGAEQLVADGRADQVARRHAARVLARVERAHRRLATADGVDVLGEIDAGLPELRGALAWLLQAGEVDDAARLVVALQHFGYLRLRPEVLTWALRVTAADPGDEVVLAPELWAIGAIAAWMAGDLQGQAERVDRALAISERRNAPLPGFVAAEAGNSALVEGRLDDAIHWSEVAVRLEPDNHGQVIVAESISVLARTYREDPDAGAAATRLLEMIGPSRTAYSAFAWYCAGEAELGRDPSLARRRFARARELAEITGSNFVAGVTGVSDASLEARDGDPYRAAASYRELLVLWRRAGMWATQWTMLRSVAAVLERTGRHRDAAVMLGAVLGTSDGHRIFGADEIALTELGTRLSAQLGDDEAAQARAEGARLDGDAAVEHALAALGR